MKYTCIIVDDKVIERDTIRMDLQKVDRLQIIAACANSFEALNILGKQEIDIVFSDIDMPDLNGLDLIKSLKRPPVFVFITSHQEYAVESYELDVVDFVVKPFSFDRIFRAANKAIEYIDLKKQAEDNKQQEFAVPGNKTDDHFFIRENHDLVKLRFDEVAYIESMGHFSKIFTLSDKKHTTLVGLKNLEQLLPSGTFMRVHKQYLVNHQHINVIGQGELTVADKYQVPVGLSYRPALLRQVVDNKTLTRFSG